MASWQSNCNIQSFPSFVSSSNFFDDKTFKNELSFRFNHDDLLDIAFQNFNEIKMERMSCKGRMDAKTSHLDLRKCTSFEEMLMENHRTVLIDSICEYFQQISHCSIKNAKRSKYFQTNSGRNRSKEALKQEANYIQNILYQNSSITQFTRDQIRSRLMDNPDQLNIIENMLSVCPKIIEFQVLFLINYLLQDCNKIIQNFQRKNFTKELKDRSIKHSGELKEMVCLSYLFQSEKNEEVASHFEILIQKWMITLFLMKVGVFENELQSKSIDECLESQIFSNIELSDLLNQHLIRPSKKLKRQ